MTTDQKIKKLNGIAKEMQAKTEELVKLHHQLIEASTDLYRGLEKPDCLFSESPIAPNRLTNTMRMYMSKLGWKWAHASPWAQINELEPRQFAIEVREAAEWARRFDKETVDKIL